MKLTLSENELNQAVQNYIAGMINLSTGTDVLVDFKAGRGENGFSAEVDISPQVVSAAQPPTDAYPEPGDPERITAKEARANSDAANAAAQKAADKVEPKETSKPTLEKETPAAKAEPELTTAATRKTSGKSLFGGKDAPAANDDVAAEPEEVPVETKAASGRKTLFSE